MKSSSTPPKIKPALTALALVITKKNAPAVTGWDFRYCKDTAQRLGVPILKVSKHRHAIRADLFLAALEKADVPAHGNAGELPKVVDCADPAAAVRAMLGKKRAGGQ